MEIPNIIATDRMPPGITGSRWHACDRKMWFQFRHVKAPAFKQETLRTFAIGHALEDLLCTWIGKPIHMREAELKNRWGGVLGRIDGIMQDGEEFVLLENKTANDKRWKEFSKKGLPQEYIAQVQLYMHHSNQLSQKGSTLQRAVFCVFNKNTSEIFLESVAYDPAYAADQTDRIHDVMSSEALPYANVDIHCNWCDYKDFCSGDGEIPLINCRTCANVSVIEGKFSCAFGSEPCDRHLINPQIMQLSGYEIVSADQEANSIDYGTLKNGIDGMSSVHIRNLFEAMVLDCDDITRIKIIFDAKELT
jgi:CRISPR/Cas system-associated exonuclease Cas4 (RecB family)